MNLAPGVRVKVQGLGKEPQYNHTEAVLTTRTPVVVNEQSGEKELRWVVVMDRDGEVRALADKNFTVKNVKQPRTSVSQAMRSTTTGLSASGTSGVKSSSGYVYSEETGMSRKSIVKSKSLMTGTTSGTATGNTGTTSGATGSSGVTGTGTSYDTSGTGTGTGRTGETGSDISEFTADEEEDEDAEDEFSSSDEEEDSSEEDVEESRPRNVLGRKSHF